MAHKSHYDPAKEKWREAWHQFIRKHRHSLRGSPQDWQVVFFPGEEALEVDVYDRLKIPRENLLGLERDPRVYDRLRKKKLGIRLTDKPVDALDFFQQTDERFEIVNLDYEGFLDHNVVKTLQSIAGKQLLQEESLAALTIYAKRDSNSAKGIYYSALMGEEFSNCIHNLIHGNPLTMDEHSFQAALSRFTATPINERRNKALTTVLINIFFKGLANLGVNPIYARNPNLSELERMIELACALSGGDQKPDEAIINFMHYKSLIDHIKKSGIASSDDQAIMQARLVLAYENRRYFPEDIARFSYVSRNGAVMLSDFFYFNQHRRVIDRYGYIAEHAYIDLNFEDFSKSIFGGRPTSKSQVVKDTNRLKRDLEFIFGDAVRNISNPPKPRNYLGSSAKLPKLKGEDYYRERFADVENGIPLADTWNRLMSGYKVRRSQLPRFEAHYTMRTYGPQAIPRETNGIGQAGQNLEEIVAPDKFELIPHQYWNRLPEQFRHRIKYFIEEDIRRTDLTPEQQKELVGEIRASKWYKTLNGNQLSNSQFYAFFDDILLELVDENLPNRKKIQELFEDVMKPNWREKSISKVKPVLTLSEYERLSFYEGKGDETILDRYTTPKPNSIRAYKAWVTMRHGEKKPKDNLGNRVAVLIRQKRSKGKIMEELGLSDYQFRGFLAAYNRGAYKHLFREQQQTNPMPRIYIDTHGVVHVNPRNAGDIEKGYK